MSDKVYLITGCSSGLGVHLSRVGLKSGAKVICTARNVTNDKEVHDELEKAGAKWLQLDTTSDDIGNRIQEALNIFGRIDVLINNAGTGGYAGPLEETSLDDAHRAFDTNLWGTVKMIQAVLPIMRKQGSGTIVNISSASVYDEAPGLAFYTASKSALDTMTACLAGEVAPFGIRTILVTPADMRTPFVSPDKRESMMAKLDGPYKRGPVEYVMQMLRDMDGNQTIDPAKAAERIVAAAEEASLSETGGVIRLPIGKNAGEGMTRRLQEWLQRVENTKDVWDSVDFPIA